MAQTPDTAVRGIAEAPLSGQANRGPALTWAGAVAAVLGLVLVIAGFKRHGGLELIATDLALGAFGWGSLLEPLGGAAIVGFLGQVRDALLATLGPLDAHRSGPALVWAGLLALVLGLALVGAAFSMARPALPVPSAAAGAPLAPRLAKYQAFHWGTLAAYGFGMLFAELGVIFCYLWIFALGNAAESEAAQAISPVTAFLIALAVGGAIAFLGGFFGAANSKRLSVPEATLAQLYFGLPVPIALTVMHLLPQLSVKYGYKLREIVYLSSQLGESRPQLGYWLVYAFLALALSLGINGGFVATSSGRLDLRASYETFIGTRHVSVFRPRLLVGVFLVLIFGILPPLLLYAIVMAAGAQAERVRIKHLGLTDPLEAAKALHEAKAKAQRPTEMMTALSVGGVGVGVMALIIVLSVMSGFELDLQKKILGTNSHGVVMKYTDSMAEYPEVMERIATVPGVIGQTPFILNEVMISSEGNISGSMIKGIDPKTVGSVTDLPSYLLPGGSLDWLEHPENITAKRLAPAFGDPALDEKSPTEKGPIEKGKEGADIERDPFIETPKLDSDTVLPGILLGRELAASMRVVVGDRINVVSPVGGELGPQGPMPKSRPFRVAGIFYSGMFEYDSKFVYIHLREASTFFNVKGATGIELKVDDIDDARRITRAIYDKLDGYPYRTKDWGEMNRNLFAALRLEKLVMGIILSIIVIVAAGLIVATVIMLVLEKRKEIAVLKALGVPDGGIVKIFLIEGLQIGIAGGVLGLIAGFNWCLFIEKVGIKLDPQVYYIPALPVRIEPLQTALAVVIAVLVTFLASIYPALKASQVEPVEGLKAE